MQADFVSSASRPFDPRLEDPAIAPLWHVAEALLRTLFSLFGGPGEIAARMFLTRRTRREMLYWLRAAEKFLRALLMAEALKRAFAPLPPAPKAPRPKHPRRAADDLDPDAPESWRVSFRVLPRQDKRGLAPASKIKRGLAPASKIKRGLAPSLQKINAAPIARRAEALLRAFNAPTRLIQRLARRLRREPHTRRRVEAPPAIRPFDPQAVAHIANILRTPLPWAGAG